MAPPALAAENPEEEEDPYELTFVIGLNSGTGFEGHIDRGAYSNYQPTRSPLEPSLASSLYAEVWFHEWFGAGLLVDSAWLVEKGCPVCVRRWWGAAGVYGVAGTDVDDNVGFFIRVAFGAAIAESELGIAYSPGFFFSAWTGFRWFALPHLAAVISVGMARLAVSQHFSLLTGEQITREVATFEGRAQLGLEVIF